MPTESDTCRTSILPNLYAAGWNDDQICEQRTFTAGRIIVHGNKTTRRKSNRADYILRYTRDFCLAVVEAKAEYKRAADISALESEIDRLVYALYNLTDSKVQIVEGKN